MARDGQLNIITLVGHKNMVTTKIYTSLDESNEERTGTISKNKYYNEGEVIKVQHDFSLSFFFLKSLVWLFRAISSAGRATALQAVGHKFEPCIAHHIPRIPGS